MKKTNFLLFLLLSLCSVSLLTAQTPEIQIKTDKDFGSEVSIYPKTKSYDTPIIVDWGDGNIESYNVDPTASVYFSRVSGSVKGETIRILSSLTSLEADNLEISSFVAIGQTELKYLNLSKNKLTKETFALNEDAPLENLNLKENDFAVLDLRSYTSLEAIDISGNPRLGTILVPDGSKTLSSISANDCDISHFYPVSLPALTTLSLENNALMDLEIGDNYPKLSSLSISHNEISELDVTKLPLLYKLEINYNNISRLNLKSNTELTNLFCNKNQLTNLDLSANTKLTSIACDSNALTTLDVSMLTKLTSLSCAGNQITLLDLTQAPYMSRLTAHSNQLTFLDFSACYQLQYLDIRSNPTMTPCAINYMLRSMWDNPRKPYGDNFNLLLKGSNAETSDAGLIKDNWKADVEGDGKAKCDSVSVILTQTEGKVTLLERMIDSDQSLKTIGDSVLAGTPLYVQIDETPEGKEYLGVKVNGKLIKEHIFVVTQDPTTVEPVFTRPPMMQMGTKVGHDISFALVAPQEGTEILIDWGNGVAERNIIGQTTKRLDGKALGDYIKVSGPIIEADLSSYPGQGTWDNEFTSLQLVQPDLQVLYTYMNPIGSIDLKDCPNLTLLDVAYTGISELDLTHCTQLDTLLCYGNTLATLDLSKLTGLRKLDAKKNQLTSIDLSSCVNLGHLDLQGNQLSEIDLSKLTGLHTLALGANKLSKIDLANQSEVETLLVNNNQLKELDLSKLTKLATLYCNGNQLTKLDLSNQPQLQMLQAYGNKLTACDVNDLYASLCSYPKGVTLQMPYSLYITEDKSNPDNDAQHADPTIATIKGWRVNTAGDASGCDQVYVEVAPTTHGEIQLADKQGNVIKPVWSTLPTHLGYHKVNKDQEIDLIIKPEEGYTIDRLTANGKQLSGTSLTPQRYTRINALFKLDNAVIAPEQSHCIAVTSEGVTTLADLAMLTIFTIDGQTYYHQPAVCGELVTLPQGSYLVTAQAVAAGETEVIQVLIP
ncbi:leucine-rich repeat domain-containing protein [Porphyromonas sp.]|uniref:leucine-rich repeat domain-containing protein n=1 Tax=Porphyromonas sp. TaxID=1924944 RepID=UPI0039921F5F